MMQANNKQSVEREWNLTTIIQLLGKRIWIVVACGLVAALLAFLFTMCFATPRYSAKVTLYANNRYSSQGSTSITTSDLSASARLVEVYAAIILSDPVLDEVIAENHLQTTASFLAQKVSVRAINNTEVFQITVTDETPEAAARIANSIAQIAPGKIAQIVDGCSVKLVSNAKIPTQRIYPDYFTTARKWFVIGLVFSAMLVILMVLLDTRIKGEEDLHVWDFPIIGIIPAFEEAEKSEKYRYRAKGDDS